VKKWQRISGYLILAYAIGLVAQSLALGLGPPGQPGPGFLGFFLGLALNAFSVGLIFLNRGSESEAITKPRFWHPGAWAKPLLALVSLVSFTVLMGLLGTVPTMVLFFLFWVKILERQGWATTFLVSVLGTGSFYTIFVVLLRIPLPRGLLAG
jgi:hypothetical protein